MTTNSLNSRSIIKGPVFSEKSSSLMPLNQYTFKVEDSATKHQIRLALKQLYDVDVVKITTTTKHSQERRSPKNGKYFVQAGYKKATIQVKKGQKIELFTPLEK